MGVLAARPCEIARAHPKKELVVANTPSTLIQNRWKQANSYSGYSDRRGIMSYKMNCNIGLWKASLSIIAIALAAGCQSGGGTKPVQVPPIVQDNDGLCHGPNSIKNCNGLICDSLTGDCVECLRSIDCKSPQAPICSQNKCVPCSEKNACDTGICVETGECVECMTDNDCASESSGEGYVTGNAVFGHVDHSYGDVQAAKTMCVRNQCVACDLTSCLGACIKGRCVVSGDVLCADGKCGDVSPIVMDDIDPRTRELANRLSIFHVDVPDVVSSEVAPFVQAYKVDARVNGMYATVTTEFVIHNPNHRVMEGELEFPLPDDGVVSGYAIDIDGIMMDAQIVEKKKARMAYENEVKKGIDPGLVEQIKGNAYRTRIYPIPAQGGRRVRVEYTAPLMIAPNGDAALALPMPDTELKQRDITISVVAQGIPAPAVGGLGDKRFTSAQAVWVVESHESNVKPGENVLVAMPNMPETIVSTENFKGERFFMASVKAADNGNAGTMPSKFRIVWDASGSRSADDIAKAREFIGHLPPNASYELHVFRNVLEPVQNISGRAKLLSVLDALAYDGGTDFASLEKVAAKKVDGMTLFFTDGMDTMTGALPQFGVKSAAIMTGAARDVSAMRRICGGRTINLDITNGEDAVKQILKVPTAVSKADGSGLSHIEGIGMPSAGRVTIVGRVEPGTSKATIVMSDGKNVSIDIPDTTVDGKTLATAWAARRVDALSPQADENREELLALGRRFSIVSPVSSMLVLENLSQWLEYDIEPPENSPLHAEWVKQRRSDAERAREKEENDNEWIAELTDLWKMRVAWYNSPKVRIEPPKTQKRPVRRWNDDDWDDDDNVDYQVLPNPYENSPDEALRDYCGAPWRAFEQAFSQIPAAGFGSSVDTSQPPPMPERSHTDSVPERPKMMMMDGGHRTPVYSGSRATTPEQMAFAQEIQASRRSSSSQSASANRVARPAYATSFAEEPASRDAEGNVEAGVDILDWDPDTPYLTAIKDAQKIYKSSDSLYKEYLTQRKKYAKSPAFYLDCAHLFFKEKQDKLALRILSNLSELKIDNVSLLRVYAWRLREAGDLDNAIIILRKVADLRPDESISWRDLALTITMRAKKNKNAKDAQEALDLYHKVIFTSWFNESYRGSDDMLNIAVLALEEFNELAAWCKRQGWTGNKITIPQTDPQFQINFESDLRIVVSWDADNTDIDLMITEPSGQEVFYGNKCSLTGGILSDDIVDGYGPEEYIHKYAPKGSYKVYTNYFASHEQSLIGAATITVTFYSNWGRSNQKSETMTLRLNEEQDKIKAGEYNLK